MMKKAISVLVCAILLCAVCILPAQAASAADYTVWKWAKPANGGSVVDAGNNTVTVSGRGVWDPNDIESIMGITFKQAVNVNGFKFSMTFNRFYGDGTTAGDGWYGVMLNSKPYGITHPNNYKAKNMKGLEILFKINKGSRARKQVTVEISTNGSDGLKSVTGQSFIVKDLPTEWHVDLEIKNGKVYICGQELSADLSKQFAERLSDGKCYPTFAGFAEDYGDVSFTVKYDQKITEEPKNNQTASKVTDSSKKQTASQKVIVSQKESATVSEKTGSSAEQTPAEQKNESSAPQGTTSETPSEITSSTEQTADSLEQTDTPTGEPTNPAEAVEQPTEESSDSSLLLIAGIAAGVILLGAVIACVIILKKGKGESK